MTDNISAITESGPNQGQEHFSGGKTNGTLVSNCLCTTSFKHHRHMHILYQLNHSNTCRVRAVICISNFKIYDVKSSTSLYNTTEKNATITSTKQLTEPIQPLTTVIRSLSNHCSLSSVRGHISGLRADFIRLTQRRESNSPGDPATLVASLT